MYLPSLVLSLVALVNCSDWCYNGCANTPSSWKNLPESSCGKKHQSPINIVTRSVVTDHLLPNFTFVNFSSENTIKSITNNGHTVQCTLVENEVEVSGGGLNGTYSVVQFHFHWGDKDYHQGSEHSIDGYRYQMEMHIVSVKKGLSVDEATTQADGFAVFGFFINATEDGVLSGPWYTLTANLTNITGSVFDFEQNNTFSIDDLIGNVDRTKFYRYYGSLTTPNCSEAVVWTIFQEPIQVPKELTHLFSTKVELINTYRPTEDLNGRQVTASPATPLPPAHSWCYNYHCDHDPSQWFLLPESHCDGKSQSPININTRSVMPDNSLNSFTFTNFDNKQAIKYIANTGHSVECVLKDDLVEVSGGGLKHIYSTVQFHFHWGTEVQNSPGSEHTVDSNRYPMEMHIVSKRKNLTLDEALKTSDGLAVLGFFIETQPTSSPSDQTAWKKLTQYFSAIRNIRSQVEVKEDISINDLLGKVNRNSYYRYSGSLTTPLCKEAVVWTIFQETIKVDGNLMTMFPKYTGFHNVYRPIQPLNARTVYTTRSASCISAPVLLYPLLVCLCAHFW
nr:uncharacterized protein LOC107387984 [Nothobranchius furzeri]XP_054605157.1 uncharacterized protein LOC107387984 [Nothobranchius furzeri]